MTHERIQELMGQMDIKGSKTRNKIAQELRVARNADADKSPCINYSVNRNAEQLFYTLHGLKYTFEYVRQVQPQNSTIYDLGSRTTEGICELSRWPLASGLAFKATVMRPVKSDSGMNRLPHEDIYITPIETRRIPSASIGGVLANFSVTYSAVPEVTVSAIDDMLVPGGVFKGSFFPRWDIETKYLALYHKFVFRGPYRYAKPVTPFIHSFIDLGYDVSVWNEKYYAVLLAIKPGLDQFITAQDIMNWDFIDLQTFGSESR